jgi:hypothetical protein
MLTPNPDVPNIPDTPEVATQLSFGAAHPLVLFPVRLETRFFALADGSSELRVRVYPDAVHIDTHETALTDDELTWGKHFWEQTWRAANDEERGKTAWRQLADRFDPPRAAWIAHALKPLNPEDRPPAPLGVDEPLPKPVRFPSVETKKESWERAPVTRVLPSRWFVLGYQAGKLVVNVQGGPIPDVLPTGPDPGLQPVDELGIDDGMKWMVDFDAAEKVGMGIRARLSSEAGAAGLDFLLVLGIKDTADATTDWTPKLAELFSAHHYTDGLGFVPQGTPTNNTADAPSGFSSNDPGHEASYHAERTAPTFQLGDGSSADVLTTALGLANVPSIFANLPNASAKEQVDHRSMNTALWQTTWGYFLLQMLGVGATSESRMTDDDIAWARSHFIDYVRASGPLPALRVGKQPYGILPVTSLDAWKPPADLQAKYARDVALRDFLVRFRDLWRRNFPETPRLGRSEDVDQAKGIDRDLAEVLSMDGQSSNYSIRNLMGRHYLEHLWVFLSAEFFSDIWGVVLDEAPPEPEPFVEEEPPPDLPPRERIAWLRAQQQARLAHARARQQWLALMEARRQRIALMAAKRAATSAWSAIHDQRTAALLQTLGVTWRPRLADGVFAPPIVKLSGALVQAAQTSTLSPNYIDALLAAQDLDVVRHETGLQPPPHTLLYLLLRHSMLLEYAAAAARLLIDRGLLDSALRREPELVHLPAGQLTQTVWQQMAIKIQAQGVQDPIEVGKYLLGFMPSGEPDVEREPQLKALSEYRASLVHLKSLNPTRLEQLLTGTLDLCTHRLDAWITSFATKRLAEMRKANQAAVLFGGYGWVMNLKPVNAQIPIVPPPGEPGPMFQLADNPGFIHTPSLTHATTAAVLRSGHLAHAGNQMPNNLLAIDLSSDRVRLATWLLDGVRQGQPLGALLGYRFERRLQEADRPQFISYFRELAPLVARKLEQTDQPVEAIAANNVVDGLELQRRWLAVRENSDALKDLFSSLAKKPPEPDLTNSAAILKAELDALADSVDAVSDALIAESVHQVVRGNPVRAATTVESIAGGEIPPPELEIARTPRTGIALTHRLVTLFSDEPVFVPQWAPPTHPFRAEAEPHLNAWVARLLVNPAHVLCLVERFEPGTRETLETKELRLSQLNLAPLDFIYAVESGQGGQQGELEQRILYTMMRIPDGFSPGVPLRISAARKSEWQAGELGYGQFCELLRAVRKLIGGVRGIDGDDLTAPNQTNPFSVDLAELEKRAAGAQESLRRTKDDLQAQLENPDAGDLNVLREVLMRAASLAVSGAVPLSAAGASTADRQTLLAQAGSIQKELARRTDEVAAVVSRADPAMATLAKRQDDALARLRIVFGKAFVVLPRFTAANGEELEKALTDSIKIQDGDPLAATTWFQRVARVRDGIARLNDALSYAEALGTGEKFKLTLAQLPYNSNDRWVGLPLKAGDSLPGGKLSLAIQSSAPIDAKGSLAGLLIDEWVEVVPNAREVTGITFQYNQPNAAPPQNILIAVPPEVELPWTVWSLQRVLLETLDLARIRAVDPDALDEVGHYLPALYFAHNTAGETVSTDFTRLKQ